MKYGATIGTIAGGIGGAFIGNPMLGASIGGSIGGGLDAMQANKEYEEQQRKMQEQLRFSQDQSYLSQYNSRVNLEEGGKVTTGGVRERLSSNAERFDGNTHDEGGIHVDFDNDGYVESEVEDGEVQSQDMIFSNKLKPKNDFLKTLDDYGIKIKPQTYAKVAEQLSYHRSKYEEILQNSDEASSNTAELMIQRIDEAIELLFENQQLRNGEN